MSKWQDQACITLELACDAISNNHLRQAIILLDETCNFITQAHLRERNKIPKSNYKGRSPTMPFLLRLMIDQAEPKLSQKRMKILLALRELRNILVHQVSKKIKVNRYQCMVFLREMLAFSSDYGVPQPKLIPSDLAEIQPIEILIEFGSKWKPNDRPANDKKHVREALEKRGMLSGIIANIGWPLVRCSLCQRLVPVDYLTTPQDEFTTEDNEPVRVYCLYGCSQAYQAFLKDQEKKGMFSLVLDSELYYLQPLLELIGGVPYEPL